MTAPALRAHIQVLASDDFLGRKPGTPGEEKTIAYIAAALARIGLEPAAEDGGWYQPVPLVERRPLSYRASWRVGGEVLTLPQDDVLLLGRGASERVEDVPVVPAAGPEAARGAAVLLPIETPQLDVRIDALRQAGAAAILLVLPDLWPQEAARAAFEDATTSRAEEAMAPVEGVIAFTAAQRLMRTGARASFEVASEVRSFVSRNVIGRLRGRGDGRESLLYLAHWDHLGVCAPEGGGDRICNGAVDNASGIALMIEVAAALARGQRPERDILFMATTAEEAGLLGAEHFAAHPTVPLPSIVAALNIDTVAIHRAGTPLAIVGRGFAPLDRAIEEEARALGRSIDTDGEADEFINRQDGWALARAGVPAVLVGGAFSDFTELNAYLYGPYHLPGDDLSRPLVLDGAAEDGALLVGLGRRLADRARYQPRRR